MSNKPLGDRGEEIAARHLSAAGWAVLARNFRLGHKEIDLVARRGEVVAFVEVKTRAGLGFGHPLEAITAKKRREIQQVAGAWIERNGAPGDTYRFDAVSVLVRGGGEPVIDHVEDAWRM
ncbi:MAG TPA: YraN family protein [Longimicrobiaceae bacterium]|jgi:putative endonuclease|nr:YraN family protein [Longimicrobiaceae bacterium]